jgi:biopolymer transport protein ExbB
MKNPTNMIIMIGSLTVSFLFYYLVLGSTSNFTDPVTKAVDMHQPVNILGTIYTGGPLVAILIACILLAITYTVERLMSIGKASGKTSMVKFGKTVIQMVEKGQYDGALAECDKQRGSLANVLRAAIERFRAVENTHGITAEQKIAEVKRVIDENMNLETPLLEKNLVILSTVASVSTMVGLLGTTIGMIRSFEALGKGGSVSAQSLSIGISEALYNTAGGLLAAIFSILAFNFFTTKVDNFTYEMDETILDLMETLAIRTGAKA